MATACFWLVTFGPFGEPECNFPAPHSCMTVATFFPLGDLAIAFSYVLLSVTSPYAASAVSSDASAAFAPFDPVTVGLTATGVAL